MEVGENREGPRHGLDFQHGQNTEGGGVGGHEAFFSEIRL